jgi:galactose mutarotase-like enzyme
MRSVSPLEQLKLRNDRLEITVLPEVGAKVLDLIDLSSGQNFLWHNTRIPPQAYPVEANFDNYWCGGWDDGFPTCETCTHKGEVYPNLGELRSVSWRVETCSSSYVHLSANGPISPIEAEKEIRLVEGTVEIRFSVRHLGYEALEFIWGTHPAYAVTPDCVLHIPASKGLVGQANHPMLGQPGQAYIWPDLETSEGSLNMSRALAPGKLAAGHYATALTAGWYAVEYPGRQSGLLFEFPLETCPYLWLWLSYGGWRGYYVVVVEPWTSCPVTLTDAIAQNTHRVLSPGQSFSCSVRATPWSKPSTLQTLLEAKGIK